MLYFCNHERFAQSAARQMFPVEPQWLVEALGLVTFVSTDQHREPQRVGRGRLRIESTIARREGLRRRVVEVDEETAAVVATHMYDENGKLLATALLSEHERDETSGAVLPRQVEIRWPASQLEFTLSLDDVVVSAFLSGPGATTLPQVLFSRARLGLSPSIHAAATLIVLFVAIGVAFASLAIARRERLRQREMAEAYRS